jgi:CRP-like cAMP-binding protein
MLTTIDKVLFLLRAPVTADCTTDALARVAQLAQELELEAGHRLFAVGDTPDALWVVIDGAVRIEGIETDSQLAESSDLIGGLAVFTDAPHVTTAVTLVTTRILRIERADLHDLLDEDGEFARALFTGLVRVLLGHRPAVGAAS